MDNKNSRGLSEAYSEVYSEDITLFGRFPGRKDTPEEKAAKNRIIANRGGTAGAMQSGKPETWKPIGNSNPDIADYGRYLKTRGEPQLKRDDAANARISAETQARAKARRGAPTPTPRTAPQPVQSTRTQRPSTGLSAPASTSRPAAATPSVASSPRPTAATAPKPAAPPTPPMSNMDKWRAANKNLATAADEKARIRGTSQTDNPLMQSFRNRLPMNSPSVQSSEVAKLGSGNQSLINNTNAFKSPPRLMKNSYDFGSPDKISQDVASLYQSIYEAKKKVDQDQDGDNDFADVRIARMIASGVPKEEAIRRTRNKSYNEETELDEGRSENIRNKMVARYGKPDSDDTLRLHVARKKYDKAATKHQRGYGPNPRTEIKGKLNPGQLMYKAGQSANVNKEEFEFWVNDLLDEGYDLSEYTVEEIYEIFEETALERKKAEEERKNERRARVAEMQAQGRVMTPAKRAAAQRVAKAAEKREAALEKAASAALNDIRGATGRVSEKPMGSEGPESKKAAPEATRRLRTGLKRDTLGSAADAALKAIRKENYDAYNLVIGHLLDEGFADDYDSANMMIGRMSDEWLNEILESKN